MIRVLLDTFATRNKTSLKSLQELCAETILDNNINYQELHYYAYLIVENKQKERNLQIHKEKFKDTLYIFNTINYDNQGMIQDYTIYKIQPIKSRDFISYDHILIVYKINGDLGYRRRYIQEIEFYSDGLLCYLS
jgi:hypothetical protein